MENHVDTPAARIGREIQRICAEERFTYKEVAERCNESLKILFPNRRLGPIGKDRIAKLVEAWQNPSARGAAKQIEDYELAAVPHALHFSLDELFGNSFRRYALVWDPLADPEYSAAILRLLKQYGDNARELVGWAEYLPCSMETSEFMRAHHDRLFRSQLLLSTGEWHRLMRQYNEFGDRRRALVHSPDRRWRLKQLMRIRDLELIAAGDKEYSFDKTLRKKQILYLADLLSNTNNNIQLILAEDEDIKSVENHLRDCDAQFCIDERISVWRNHGGKLSWSEDTGVIAQNRAVLQEFEERASCKSLQDVQDRLLYYLQEVR